MLNILIIDGSLHRNNNNKKQKQKKNMLQNSSEYNALGAGVGYGGGYGGNFLGGNGGAGIGAFGLFGLLGIDSLTGRRHNNDDGGGPGRNELATLAAISNAKDATVSESRILAAAVTNAKDATIAEGRGLAAAICESEKTNLNQFYANAVQQARLAQDIQNQASAIAIVADKRFDDLAAAGVNQTAAILARINQSEVDSLRDQLHETRRNRDAKEVEIQINNSAVATQNQLQAQAQFQVQRDADDYRRRYQGREIEINNINTNTNVQAQLQAQAQAQLVRDFEHARRFDALFSQSNKSNQDIVNLGTMVASGVQTPTSTNVNSKQS